MRSVIFCSLMFLAACGGDDDGGRLVDRNATAGGQIIVRPCENPEAPCTEKQRAGGFDVTKQGAHQ